MQVGVILPVQSAPISISFGILSGGAIPGDTLHLASLPARHRLGSSQDLLRGGVEFQGSWVE